MKSGISRIGRLLLRAGYASIAILLGLAATGREPRAYEVLEPSARIEVAGRPEVVDALATRYQPHYFLPPGVATPPLLEVTYEAVPNDERVDLVYHFVWQGEENPAATANALYAVFRAAYFGYPLRDIEFVQVSVELRSGWVREVLFESADEVPFEQLVQRHLRGRYTRAGAEATYLLELKAPDGQILETAKPVTLHFAEPRRLTLEVATWNHLSKPAAATELPGWQKLDAPLRSLAAEEYRDLRFARKSQGDHRTAASRITPWLTGLAFLAVAVAAEVAIRKRTRGWSRP